MNIDLLENDFISTLDISEEVSLSAGYEHDSFTFRTSTTSTTDSVNVCLWIFWYVVVDYEHNVFHIESTSRNVCRDEDITESILESFEGTSSVSLLHISVKTSGRESVTFEHIGDILCFVFHSAEYNDFYILVILDIFLEHLIFLKVWNFNKRMIDFRYHEIFSCLDRLISFSYVFSEEIIYFLWNSSGECHRLFHISEA